MTKVLIWSDAHIHPHKKNYDRLNDCLKALEWVFETAEEKKVSDILFCGDLFHDRQRIDIPTYQRVFEIFGRYLNKPKAPQIYLLLGNHDLWHYEKWDISSVFPLSAIPKVTVVAEPCSLDVSGYEIGFLPYTHDPETDLKKIDMKSKFKVLCAHVALDGAIWNTLAKTISDVSIEHDGDMVKVTADVFKDYDQVFLGHYHGEQKMNDTVEYVGSPLQLSFGEAFQKKHIIVYDLKTKEKEYIRNTFSPEHYPVKPKDLAKIKLENNFIRLMVDDMSSSEVVELKNELAKKNLGSLKIQEISKSVEDEQQLITDAKAILSSGEEMLLKYLESLTDLGGLNKDKLLKIGQTICEENQEE